MSLLSNLSTAVATSLIAPSRQPVNQRGLNAQLNKLWATNKRLRRRLRACKQQLANPGLSSFGYNPFDKRPATARMR
jgi:hypothetical protein